MSRSKDVEEKKRGKEVWEIMKQTINFFCVDGFGYGDQLLASEINVDQKNKNMDIILLLKKNSFCFFMLHNKLWDIKNM